MAMALNGTSKIDKVFLCLSERHVCQLLYCLFLDCKIFEFLLWLISWKTGITRRFGAHSWTMNGVASIEEIEAVASVKNYQKQYKKSKNPFVDHRLVQLEERCPEDKTAMFLACKFLPLKFFLEVSQIFMTARRIFI